MADRAVTADKRTLHAATIASGCRCCGREWPDEQLVFRSGETWATTCTHCGQRQPWAWVRSLEVADG